MKHFIYSSWLFLISTVIFAPLTIGQTATSTKEGSSILLAGLQMNVTPEGSLSGYTSTFNQEELNIALEEIKTVAATMKVGLMLGNCYKELRNGKEFCFNQVRVYTPEGNFKGAYSKILRSSNLDLPGTGDIQLCQTLILFGN